MRINENVCDSLLHDDKHNSDLKIYFLESLRINVGVRKK